MHKLFSCSKLLALVFIGLCIGCSKKDPTPSAVTDPRDAWVGTWTGNNTCQAPACGASAPGPNTYSIIVSIAKSPSSTLQIIMIITTPTTNGNVSSQSLTGTVVGSQATFSVTSGSLSATLNGALLTITDQSLHPFTCTVNGVTTNLFNSCSSGLTLNPGTGTSTGNTTGNTTLTFVNNSFTAASITVNQDSRIIQPGGNVVFSGAKGAAATGVASTSGTTTNGIQVGSKITWNINTSFPSTGNTTTNLDVNGDIFFVKVTNQSSKTITKFYANYGLSDQTLDNISIPNNGTEYSIGYYKAYSNSNVRAESGDGSFWSWSSSLLALTFKNNQVVTLKAN